MDAEGVKTLKEKCNELISSVKNRKEELEQINKEIQQLTRQKECLEEQHKNISGDKERTVSDTTVCKELLEEMKLLSKQLEEMREPGEQGPRKKTQKERLWGKVKEALRKIWNFLRMLLGTIMLSIIATILLNEHLRNMLMEILKECLN